MRGRILRCLVVLLLGCGTAVVGHLLGFACGQIGEAAENYKLANFLCASGTGLVACVVLAVLLLKLRGVPLSTKVATVAFAVSTLVFAMPMAGVLLKTERFYFATLGILLGCSLAMWFAVLRPFRRQAPTP